MGVSVREFIPPSVAFLLMAGSLCAAAESGKSDQLTAEAINRRILEHRTAQATLTLTSADGQPLANTAVVVRQTRHKFLFGCNAFRINTGESTQGQQDYRKRFAELLNFATLPFYWGGYEPVEGKPGEAKLKMMAEWCRANGIRIKGHPLCWHQVPPRWSQAKSLDDLEKLQLGRITREVTTFTGLIDTWDVVNEAVVMPNFKGENSPIPAMCAEDGRQCRADQAAHSPPPAPPIPRPRCFSTTSTHRPSMRSSSPTAWRPACLLT